MTSLGDTYDVGGDQRRTVQLVAGAGLLLAGSVAFGLGFVRVASDVLAAAGLAEPLALSVGAAVAGLLVPGAFVGVRKRLSGRRGEQWLAPGGGLVGFSVAAFLATAVGTGAVPSGSTAGVLGIAYAAGLALILASVLAAAVESGSPAPRRHVSYRRSTARQSSRTPADGGEDEDDDLTFPLDEDE